MLRDWVAEFSPEFGGTGATNSVYVSPTNKGRQHHSLAPSSRFNVLTSKEELATLSKGFVPANTLANTEWAVRNFSEWAEWRRKVHPEDPVPGDILRTICCVIIMSGT